MLESMGAMYNRVVLQETTRSLLILILIIITSPSENKVTIRGEAPARKLYGYDSDQQMGVEPSSNLPHSSVCTSSSTTKRYEQTTTRIQMSCSFYSGYVDIMGSFFFFPVHIVLLS